MLKQIFKLSLLGFFTIILASIALVFIPSPTISQSETTYGYARSGIDDPLVIETNPPTDQPCDERTSSELCEGIFFIYREGTFYSFSNSQDGVIEVPDGTNPTRGIIDDGETTREITLLWPELFEEMFPDAGNEEEIPGNVKVTVTVRYDGAPKDDIFVQPDTLSLKRPNGNTLKEVETNSPEILSVPFNFVGEFENIEPGDYKVCSKVLDKCKNFKLRTGDKEVFISGTVDYDSLETVGGVGDGINCKSNGSLGWIFCGVIGFAQETIDVAKNFIVSYLETAPLNTKGDLFESWKGIRTLANVLLIPVFFMIIFSQALSLNIDAYTIKKMLPRLIAATILIQFSFYFVALALDITNVLGNGLGNLLTASFKSNNIIDISPNSFVSGIGIAGLVLGSIGAVATGMLFTLMIPFLLAILGVLFTLIFRTVLIAMLAMLAPIAFAAWVLPNTEKLFKLWWNTLLRVLMMYPLITALFAAGTIAAGLLSGDDVQIKGVGQDTVSDIAAIAALIVPLALVPFTFKAAGGVMGMVGGQIDKLRRGVTRDKQGKARPWYQKRLQRGADNFADIRAGGKGRTMRALFNPQSFAPGSIPLPGGKRMGIPILGKMGADARGGVLEQWNAKRAAASKRMEELGINNPDILRGLVRAGQGQADFRKYTKELRESGQGVQARMLETVHAQTGTTAVQAAAAVKLAESGQINLGDVEALRGSMQGNAPAFEGTVGDISYQAKKNGRPELSAFKTTTNSTGMAVRGVAVDRDKVKQNILQMNEEAIGGIRDWGASREYFDEVLAEGGTASDELVGNLRRTLASGGVSGQSKEAISGLLASHGIDARPPTLDEEQERRFR